jgi:hypothetical protein
VGHKDEPWVLAATVTQLFYILIPKTRRNTSLFLEKQQIIGLDDVENEEEYNQCDEVPFFVDTKRINNVETKISYNEII